MQWQGNWMHCLGIDKKQCSPSFYQSLTHKHPSLQSIQHNASSSCFCPSFQAALLLFSHLPDTLHITHLLHASNRGTNQTTVTLPTPGLSGLGCRCMHFLAMADGNHLISAVLMSPLDSWDTSAAPILIGWLLIFHSFKYSTSPFPSLTLTPWLAARYVSQGI